MNEDLREFIRSGSSEAFRQIVGMYTDTVYSQSLRQLRDPALAEEVTQMVFIALAKNARRISPHAVLAGWLFKTTRHCCGDVRRAQFRRRKYEQQAMVYRSEILEERVNELHVEAQPLLNDALAGLGGRDRDAILLRYFQGQSLRDVGAAMGVSEDAAKQRISRAVEKLRRWFAGEGLVVPSGMIVSWLGEAVKPAPGHLALKIGLAPLSKPAMSIWGMLGSKVAAGVVLGTITVAAATVGVKAIANGNSAPVVMADAGEPATQPAVAGDQATPVDTLRKLSAAIHAGDRTGIDACLMDDGTDPDTAALVRAQFHLNGAWCRARGAARKAFNSNQIPMKTFNLTLFPALDGNFETMIDKMLEKGAEGVKIDGDRAQVRVNVARGLFDWPGQNRMRFLERWSGATLFFEKVNGDWKMDTSRTINLVLTNFDTNDRKADALKLARQMLEMGADVVTEVAGQIESGELASPAAAGEAIDRRGMDAMRAGKLNGLGMMELRVVGG